MNKLVENLIKQLPQMEVGQVWSDGMDQLVITNVDLIEAGIVRAAYLGEDLFGDKHDVVINKSDYQGYIFRDRCVMRVTNAPIGVKDLTQYHFSLKKSDVSKVLKSLKKNKFYFDDMQALVNERYLRKVGRRMEELKVWSAQ